MIIKYTENKFIEIPDDIPKKGIKEAVMEIVWNFHKAEYRSKVKKTTLSYTKVKGINDKKTV